MLYSKSTGGFYSKVIHPTIPEDAVEVSDSDYKSLFQGQTQGKIIVADADGYPVLSDPVVSPAVQLRDLQASAKLALTDSDVTVLRCIERGVAIPVIWVAYRVELRAIVSATVLPSPATLPEAPAYPAGS